MRKRRILGDLPPSRLPKRRLRVEATSVPDVQESQALSKRPATAADDTVSVRSARSVPSSKKATRRQKRLIALLTVILVSISIPVLVLTLMFAG